MYKKRIFTSCVLLIGLLSFTNASPSKDKSLKKINALAFWGYLDNPKITQIVENKCKVTLSHDVYYSNEEFLDIFNKRKKDYDVIIFSNLVYGSIKDKVGNNKSNLWKVSQNYYPYFKNYYLNHNYPKNVVFFSHALMGFIYNPTLINILPNQNIFDIFKNAKNNAVILVDDPAEINNLLTLGYKSNLKNSKNNLYNKGGSIILSYENLKRVTQNSKLFITNDFNQIYKKDNFAFGFLWSGDALLYLKQSQKPYKFVLNPSLSFICTDLLAELSETPEAKCVAKALETPEIMKYVQSSTYYFTPYFQNNINDPQFNDLYIETKKMLPHLSWIEPVLDMSKYINQWDIIKLKTVDDNNK